MLTIIERGKNIEVDQVKEFLAFEISFLIEHYVPLFSEEEIIEYIRTKYMDLVHQCGITRSYLQYLISFETLKLQIKEAQNGTCN